MKLKGNYIVDKYGSKVNHRQVVMWHGYKEYLYLELDDFKTIIKLYGTKEEYHDCEAEYWGEQ